MCMYSCMSITPTKESPENNVHVILNGSITNYSYSMRVVHYNISNMKYAIIETYRNNSIAVINVTKDSLEVLKIRKELNSK